MVVCCIEEAHHCTSSYSNWPSLPVFLVFTATFLGVAYTQLVGDVGNPYSQLYTVSYQTSAMKVSRVEQTTHYTRQNGMG